MNLRCPVLVFPLYGRLLCLLLSVVVAVAMAQQSSPFTLDELLTALRSGRPPQPVLIRQVSSRHAGFLLTAQNRARLVAAGAKPDLLSAIEFNPELDTSGSQPAPASKPAARSATASAPAPGRRPAEPAPSPSVQESPDQEIPVFRDDAIAEFPTGPVTPHEITAALVKQEDQGLLAATLGVRGVSFSYTPDLGRAWRAEGARAELLAAIATAKVTLPPIPDGFVAVPLARATDYNEQATKGRLDLRLHVDDTVEVRLQGGRVVWKTLKGQDGRALGSEFTQPFPMGPLRNLNVTKRDGRGQFVVLQQPADENDYEMMLRIYDPRGGADRYHLRLEWEHFN